MKKVYAILLTRKLGQVEILPESETDNEQLVRENCRKMNEMFQTSNYTPCELCPVAMEVAQ